MKKNLFCCLILILFCQYIFPSEYSYNSSQIASLKSKLNGNLSAGDVVYLEDGNYNDLQIVFSGNGTSSNPIILKAKNSGKAILTGKINIKIGGKYLVIDGLTLKDGMAANGSDIIEFRTSSSTFAYNCRLTNIVIDNCNNPDESYRNSADKSERWIMLYGTNNRVDHCYFTNKINGGVLMMVNIKDEQSQNNNHIIDYNFFGNRPYFTPGNNAETIRLGDSQTSQLSCNTLIENNFFYTCDGEVEIISIKSCDNTIRKNVFYESQGSVVCRHGHRNTIESNAFIGNNINNCGGVRIINEGHKVYNNFFQDLSGTGSRSALCVMMGIFEKPTSSTDIEKEPLNAYHRVKDVEICHNTFINCKNIDLGTNTKYTYPSNNPYFPNQTVNGTLEPECKLSQNVFYNTSENSIINQININKITYSNNIYRFKKNISIDGFLQKSLNYSKETSEYAKGIYKLANTDEDVLNISTGFIDYSYVIYDISGNVRNGIKSVGAQQFSNKELPFLTVKPSECGVNWYTAQDTDIEKITQKTDFWEKDNPNGLSELKSENNINITNTNNIYHITSDSKISDVFIFDIKGCLITSQHINSYSASVSCNSLNKGIYILKITSGTITITRKISIN